MKSLIKTNPSKSLPILAALKVLHPNILSHSVRHALLFVNDNRKQTHGVTMETPWRNASFDIQQISFPSRWKESKKNQSI